jgi:hypothetical protein
VQNDAAAVPPTCPAGVSPTCHYADGGCVSACTFYAASSNPPSPGSCCDYDGVPALCGDKICRPGDAQSGLLATIILGAGTLSKMPGVALTDRPAFTNADEIVRSAQPTTGTAPKTLELIQHAHAPPDTWFQLCPGGAAPCSNSSPDPSWPAPRFGHSVVAVGFSTVLVYGGMGCSKYVAMKVNNKDSTRCTALKLLDDLWEVNMMKAVSGSHDILSKLLTSPSMPGLAGMTQVVLPGADHRVLMLGGSDAFHAATLIMQGTPSTIDGLFQVRDIEFRAGKGSRTNLRLRELSSNTMVQNGTDAILFGGFIGNSLSSAVFKYDLAASSPTLAFSPMMVLSQQAPPARGFSGLVKPDISTLVVFGGYSGGTGLADMWRFDIVSSSWKNLFKEDRADPALPVPTAFNAMAYFYTPTKDLVLCAHGGLQGGYKAGTSFRPGVSTEHQVSKNAKYTLWEPSERKTSQWDRVVTAGPPECCNPSDNVKQALCTQAGYAYPCPECCEPQARAMHSLAYFSETNALLSFGGVNEHGTALPDLLDISMDITDIGLPYEVRLTNMAPIGEVAEADMLADFKSIFCKMFALVVLKLGGWGPDGGTNEMQEIENTFALHFYGFKYTPATKTFGMYARLSGTKPPLVPIPIVDGTKLSFDVYSLWNVAMNWKVGGSDPDHVPPARDAWISARNAMQTGAALRTSVFNGTTLDLDWCAEVDCLPQSSALGIPGAPLGDVAFVQTTFQDQASCDSTQPASKCMRGICMGNVAALRGAVSYDGNDQLEYCYRDGSTSPYKFTMCTDEPDFSCSLPGPRHGHRAVTFTVLGELLTLAVFGGEATNLVPPPPGSTSLSRLSSDTHVLSFAGGLGMATWVKLWTSCDDFVAGRPACPAPRRDPAIAIMGNSGGENGRLLVFGGMGGANYRHGMYHYLQGSSATARPVVYNDLWYLDLAALDLDCVEFGTCSTVLVWNLIDVTGSRPRTGFGAGVLLDPSDNLYITGGGDASLVVRDDLFVFQLRDPYFKHCSATGSALTRAMAGVKSVFYLQCMDAFMEPADGASFRVDIAGPVGMMPGIVSLGGGKYSCSYTPVTIGTYTLTIYVGRGGEKYQDLITGRDTEPSNNVLDDEFEKQCTYDAAGTLACKSAQNPYLLTVVPASTSPDVTRALGSFLTLSTAGTAANFVITAKDAFGNRRPGGDSITALMSLWQCNGKVITEKRDADECIRIGNLENPGSAPETGTVADNADGSFSTSYLITRAGLYKLEIRVSGALGVDSPFMLSIFTAEADKSLTYAYGILQGISAGVSSQLYVQTRDQFGNKIRAEESVYALGEVNGGTEGIDFQVCRTVGSGAESEKCAGGDEYTAVGVTIQYSVGPDGNTNDPDTSEPYWGLYQITYFPFTEEIVQPRILHFSKEDEEDEPTAIQCYFDTSGIAPLRSLMDPGDDLANGCIDQVASFTRASILGLRGE